jgi:hypothetical protein
MGRLMTALLLTMAVVGSAAGCVSMPDSGPVLSAPVTQGPSSQNQAYLQLIPKPPQAGASPADIVRGFLTASASFSDGQQVAREYLIPAASKAWHPNWSASVFSGTGPVANQTGAQAPTRSRPAAATVTVSGHVQAKLSNSGAYTVPPTAGATDTTSVTFSLVKSAGGQWRIKSVPDTPLLLTTVEFTADYQLRNLYFLDPHSQFLVPDPVYVPLQTTPANLLKRLVQDLINPPSDWLADGTRTAFPHGTTLQSSVVVNGGAAEVNLGGAMAKTTGNQMREQVSSQLLSTLSGSGQGQPLVQSVVLEVDGKAWSPPKAQDNPVQHSTTLNVPTGTSGKFYYLDAKGNVWSATSGGAAIRTRLRTIGTGYSAIAVSPDGQYLAALRRGSLFTGPLRGTGALTGRAGSGYTTMSWDTNDNLWATSGGQLYMLPGDVTGAAARTTQDQAEVLQPGGQPETEPVTAVRISPDGVRAAFIIGGKTQTLSFGAIVSQQQRQITGRGQGQVMPLLEVNLAPFYVSGGAAGFTGVSWYGPDNVITIGAKAGAQGPPLTEYSVNGGPTTHIPSEAGISSIATSAGSELVAEAAGTLLTNASTAGAWAPAGDGLAPAYPG